MFGVVKFGGTCMWAVPVAILVAFALLLSVPEDHAPASVQSVSVQYTETVILPEVSRAYSTIGDIEPGHVELVSERSSGDATRSRNAGAVTADQEELSVIRFGLDTGHFSYSPNTLSTAWHNDDVFYVALTRNLYSPISVLMIDASANTVTTWSLADVRVLYYGSYYGIVDSSGTYYFQAVQEDLIFRLDPNTGSLTTWNKKGLVDAGHRIFADAQNTLYFGAPSGIDEYDTLRGDAISVPKAVPIVTLSSTTGTDRLGEEFTAVSVEVDSRGGRTYGTLTAPDGAFRITGNGLTPLGNERSPDGLSIPGTLGEYTATVWDRFGTATTAITLTEEQKVVQKSSPRPQVAEPQSVSVLANKLDPNTNQITTFYREGDDLPYMILLDVDASGMMYFGVFHGTRDHYATGIAKFDQSSNTITTWPNIQCNITDVAVTGNKIYCLSNNKMVELDMSSNTVRQWTDPELHSYQNRLSIDADSAGTVFFDRGSSDLARFVPSTGTFTTFDIENISWVQVDSSDTLRAVYSDKGNPYALTIR